MTDFTIEQKRVLGYLSTFGTATPLQIRADLRCALAELEVLGMAERVTEYRLTPAGLEAIEALSSQDRKEPQ